MTESRGFRRVIVIDLAADVPLSLNARLRECQLTPTHLDILPYPGLMTIPVREPRWISGSALARVWRGCAPRDLGQDLARLDVALVDPFDSAAA